MVIIQFAIVKCIVLLLFSISTDIRCCRNFLIIIFKLIGLTISQQWITSRKQKTCIIIKLSHPIITLTFPINLRHECATVDTLRLVSIRLLSTVTVDSGMLSSAIECLLTHNLTVGQCCPLGSAVSLASYAVVEVAFKVGGLCWTCFAGVE